MVVIIGALLFRKVVLICSVVEVYVIELVCCLVVSTVDAAMVVPFRDGKSCRFDRGNVNASTTWICDSDDFSGRLS